MHTSGVNPLSEVMGPGSAPVAILVNGPSSSGKTTLCRALQDRLAELADGDSGAIFARVAFDDVVPLMSDKLYPICWVQLVGGDVAHLVSREPQDGRSGWDYLDERHAVAQDDGKLRIKLVLNQHGRQLLAGLHRGWGQHLELGTNLIIDHFLQEREWQEEIMALIHQTGARLLCVGVYCSVAELERREAFRGDGGLEERPRGLALRSSELCHSYGLHYHVIVNTDQQTTAESVDLILSALQG